MDVVSRLEVSHTYIFQILPVTATFPFFRDFCRVTVLSKRHMFYQFSCLVISSRSVSFLVVGCVLSQRWGYPECVAFRFCQPLSSVFASWDTFRILISFLWFHTYVTNINNTFVQLHLLNTVFYRFKWLHLSTPPPPPPRCLPLIVHGFFVSLCYSFFHGVGNGVVKSRVLESSPNLNSPVG